MAAPRKAAGLSSKAQKQIETVVNHYNGHSGLLKVMLNQLTEAIHGSPALMKHVHSTKWRLKDPDHLRDKLIRKALKAEASGRPFSVTEKNLFRSITDLVGFRILHLHTQQIVQIDAALRRLFTDYRYVLHEEPKARTWDDESRTFFRTIGIKPIKSPTMYTSVHYVVRSNHTTAVTCEIQVRTLAEELWGEVDHSMNYPHPSAVLSCREQIKVLARVTSSCSRLVDSIFRSAQEAANAR